MLSRSLYHNFIICSTGTALRSGKLPLAGPDELCGAVAGESVVMECGKEAKYKCGSGATYIYSATGTKSICTYSGKEKVGQRKGDTQHSLDALIDKKVKR
jgi:hypothetical protein